MGMTVDGIQVKQMPEPVCKLRKPWYLYPCPLATLQRQGIRQMCAARSGIGEVPQRCTQAAAMSHGQGMSSQIVGEHGNRQSNRQGSGNQAPWPIFPHSLRESNPFLKSISSVITPTSSAKPTVSFANQNDLSSGGHGVQKNQEINIPLPAQRPMTVAPDPKSPGFSEPYANRTVTTRPNGNSIVPNSGPVDVSQQLNIQPQHARTGTFTETTVPSGFPLAAQNPTASSSSLSPARDSPTQASMTGQGSDVIPNLDLFS